MRTDAGGYRRDYLRALAQRVEVDARELRIMGSKSELLRTLVAASSAKTAGFGVPSFVPNWRAAGTDPRTVRPNFSKTSTLPERLTSARFGPLIASQAPREGKHISPKFTH
jgi:hypothetical protein